MGTIDIRGEEATHVVTIVPVSADRLSIGLLSGSKN